MPPKACKLRNTPKSNAFQAFYFEPKMHIHEFVLVPKFKFFEPKISESLPNIKLFLHNF